jgi:plastocyanin
VGSIVLMAAAAAALSAPAARASGGGGCGRPVTDARGTSVRIKGFCFGPTVLHIQVGQSVTWTNRDAWAHQVMGASAAWGSFDGVGPGQSATYAFHRAGVYPYVCALHPGMVGAVVVGRGDGPGAARVTTVQPGAVTQVMAAPAPILPAAASLAATTPPGGLSSAEVMALAAFGLALWTVVALAVQRRALLRGGPDGGAPI